MVSYFTSKSTCIIRSYRIVCILHIYNKRVEFVKSFAHLGHIITTQQNDDDIKKRRYDFIGQVNNMLCYISKLSSSVRYKLFRAHCSSFYGCELWLLLNQLLEDISISSRKSLDYRQSGGYQTTHIAYY